MQFGKREQARQILETLKERSRQGYVPSYYFVLVYTALGETDLAFESLERAYQERSTVLAYRRLDPRLGPLRSDPRFGNLLARLGVGTSVTARAEGFRKRLNAGTRQSPRHVPTARAAAIHG